MLLRSNIIGENELRIIERECNKKKRMTWEAKKILEWHFAKPSIVAILKSSENRLAPLLIPHASCLPRSLVGM